MKKFCHVLCIQEIVHSKFQFSTILYGFHINEYVCMHICIWIYMYMCVYVYTHICIYVYTCICMYVYICIIVLFYFLHSLTHTHTHTHTHTLFFCLLFWPWALAGKAPSPNHWTTSESTPPHTHTVLKAMLIHIH